MLPQIDSEYNDGLRHDFVIDEQPSKTFKIDFENNRILGEIDGIKAVKQAVYIICKVERYKWRIHDWNFGVEIEELIGKNVYYAVPELERRFKEALMQDDRILNVHSFKHEIDKGTVYLQFTVDSVYGEFSSDIQEVTIK